MLVASVAYDPRAKFVRCRRSRARRAVQIGTKTMTSPFASGTSTASSKLALAWTNVKGIVHDHALLAVLELQRAGVSFVKMVAAGIIISILVVSAWMGLVAAAIVWAVGAGANWSVTLVVAAVVNVAVAVGLAFWAKNQIPDLLFAATLRQLKKDVPHAENEHAPNRSVA
jgi:uncharacterized membrane protein YqjE